MPTIEGKTLGLKPNQLKRLEKLYQRRVPPAEIVTSELARQLTEISHEIRRQVGVLINRKGHIEHVIVGDTSQIVLPVLDRSRLGQARFNGLRCLHTHLRGEKGLTRDDLNDLAILRLDLMAAIDVNEKSGLPELMHAAHVLPASGFAAQKKAAPKDDDDDDDESAEPEMFGFLDEKHPGQLDVNFIELIEALESEMARNRGARKASDTRDRALLVGVTKDSVVEAEESMDELKELALSGDLVVLDTMVQRRNQLDPATLVGKGKLSEIIIRSLQRGADMIVFDRELSPAQVRSINAATDLKIVDRSQLILDIFAQRAQTSEGRIQVELAQLKYMLPRLSGSGAEMSRLMGGIGGRGPGETKLEVDRRRVRDRITLLEQQLDKVRTTRQQRRAQRSRREMPVVSIVGYTNAGKSTLLNALTQSKVHAEQRMFATLDPTSRRLRLPQDQEIIINDTVGFIRDLPKDLLTAFKATLEEVEQSDLLIHLVDASSPQLENQLASVQRILGELEMSNIPQLLVFNKMDLVPPVELEHLCQTHHALPVSALERRSLSALADAISARLNPQAPLPTMVDGAANVADLTFP
ncbi:MAG: GTPase HflX [Acidobacteria bacterium]|nr:GTPase HflX [Acidobacteriota bacterium]